MGANKSLRMKRAVTYRWFADTFKPSIFGYLTDEPTMQLSGFEGENTVMRPLCSTCPGRSVTRAFPSLLCRDVVWRVPVGTGVLALLSCPRWIAGPRHSQTSHIW
jgi:hypothetical protein